MLDIFKLLIKLWDLAALELKFRFPYVNHFTCSQIDIKHSKTLHLLQVSAFTKFGVFLQLLIVELKQELLLLKNYLLGDKIYVSKSDYL